MVGVKSKPGISLALGLGAWMLLGCLGTGEDGARGVRVKPQLVRAGGEASAQAALPGAARAAFKQVGSAAASADHLLHWSSDFAITSFRIPIKRISLFNADFNHQTDIYICPGSSDDCRVDMAGTAFQDLLDAAPRMVSMGEYAYVLVNSCGEGESEYGTALTGSVSLDGKTWYTHAASGLDTTGPAAPVTINTGNCGRTFTLPRPLRITDSLGAEVDFKLYFDLHNLAYAGLASRLTSPAWNPDNCTHPTPAMSDVSGPPYLCIGYPDVSGIIDSAPVTLERYRVNAGATVGLFFNSDDLPVGGYTRPNLVEGLPSDPGFTARFPIRNLRKNADGTIYVDVFGPNGHAYDTDKSLFRVTDFRRSDHSGTFLSTDGTTLVNGSHAYEAVRLTP